MIMNHMSKPYLEFHGTICANGQLCLVAKARVTCRPYRLDATCNNILVRLGSAVIGNTELLAMPGRENAIPLDVLSGSELSCPTMLIGEDMKLIFYNESDNDHEISAKFYYH